MIRRFCAVLLLAGWLVPAGAAQDLLATWRQATEGDPVLAQARARLEADHARLDQARALFLPNVSLDADYYAVRDDQRFGGASPEERDFRTHSYGIGLVQPLFRAESFALFDQAELLIVQSELGYANAQQDLAQRVAEGYFRVLRARNDLNTFDSEIKAIGEQLKRARRTFELGTGTITDVNEAQARLDLTEARRLTAENELLLAREALRRITGQPVATLAPLRAGFEPTPPAAPADGWAARAERDNLLVKQTEAAFALARKEVSRQQAQRYPRLDLVARYGHSYQGFSGFGGIGGEFETDRATVGVTVSMPLYTGGLISAQVREARADKDQSLAQLAEARRAASLAAEQASLSLRSSQLQIRALEQALRSITVTETSIAKGLELGLRSTLDLLDAQRERFAAERDLDAARYQYLLNWLRLRIAIGEAAGPEPLEQLNGYLASP